LVVGRSRDDLRQDGYRALTRKGKLKTVAVTAVARELSAFIWAINRQIANPLAAAR
jgi:hypothetical protein